MKLSENPNDLVKIENPVYQSYEEICRNFFGKAVLITEIEYDEREKILGGVVTWYTLTNKGIYDKWGECMESLHGDRCMVKPMFPVDFAGGII
jgi:hypothetical protein